MKAALALAIAAAAIASTSAHAAVPTTINFTARLVDDETEKAVTGDHSVKFELFDAATGGASVWNETRQVAVEDGLLFVDLGETKALDPVIFNGRKLFLSVTLDGAVMDPRIALDSVPYAIRASAASNADTLGGITAEELQKRVTGVCGAGNFIIGINTDGTVVCAPDLSGTGDITDVLPGSGLEGGGTTGSVTLGLLSTCLPNQLLKWNGTTWACAADANSGGDITSVTTGPASGLTGGNTTGDAALSLITTCAAGQMLKWNGAAWACANDIDTNSSGDITGVTTGPASGLIGGVAAGDAVLSLLTSCTPGQLLKWNGTAWGCANDIDTDTDTNSGGDITDVLAGNGLTGGGAIGAVSLDVGAGTGITVAANSVALDTTFTDTRYVNTAGDTMTGAIDFNQQRALNRGCPPGHVRIGPGLCTENSDASGFTFGGCANRCRAAGTHMCSSGEMRAVMLSGVTLAVNTLLDWLDDQDADDSALFVNSTTSGENIDGARATTTSSFCRCCANVE